MQYALTFKAYKEALRNDKLRGLKCQDCGIYIVPPKKVCPQCTGESLSVIELSGKGKIRTFTVIRTAPEGYVAPYVVCMVELDEGPWFMGNLSGIQADKVTMDIIGKEVKMGSKVIPADLYSAGERVAPCFTLVS